MQTLHYTVEDNVAWDGQRQGLSRTYDISVSGKDSCLINIVGDDE